MTDFIHPLHTVALKVLEDWGMMLVDKAENSTKIFNLDEPLYLSQVKMNGAFEGVLYIVAQREFIHTLAANLLGSSAPDETSESDSQDAFREMANVLAGNFITEAYGDDVAFDILNPSVSQILPEDLGKLIKPTFSYFFMADDSPVCITFDLKH